MKAEYADAAVIRYLMTYMQPDNALALEVSLQTGLRIDDVLSAKTDNLSGFILRVVEKKTGKKQTKKLEPATVRRLRANARDGYIFPTKKKSARKTSHKTRQAVFLDLRKAVDRAGISAHISPHSARKSYAVDVYHDGGLSAVKAALNHDRELTSMLYAFSDRLTEHPEKLNEQRTDNDEIARMFAKIELQLQEIAQKLDKLTLNTLFPV